MSQDELKTALLVAQRNSQLGFVFLNITAMLWFFSLLMDWWLPFWWYIPTLLFGLILVGAGLLAANEARKAKKR